MSSQEEKPPSGGGSDHGSNANNPDLDPNQNDNPYIDENAFWDQSQAAPAPAEQQPPITSTTDLQFNVPAPSNPPAPYTFGLNRSPTPKYESIEALINYNQTFLPGFNTSNVGRGNMAPQSTIPPAQSAYQVPQLPNPFVAPSNLAGTGYGYQLPNNFDRAFASLANLPSRSRPGSFQGSNASFSGLNASQAGLPRSLTGHLSSQYPQQGLTPDLQQPQTGYRQVNDDDGDGAWNDDGNDDGTEDPRPRHNTPAESGPGLHGPRATRTRQDLITRSEDPPRLPGLPGDEDRTVDIESKYGINQSGRNLMAVFPRVGDLVPRTRYRIRIERGRAGKDARDQYPPSNEVIPAGLTLEEICRRYPNHVWGTGLRLFMHELMNAEAIWKATPENVRHDGFKIRPHNYLQQAIGRENDKIHFEMLGRDRAKLPKAKKEEDDGENDDGQPATKKRKRNNGSAAPAASVDPGLRPGWFHQPYHGGVMPSAPGPAFTAPPAAAQQPSCPPPDWVDHRDAAERDLGDLDWLIGKEVRAQRDLIRQIMTVRYPQTATYTAQQWTNEIDNQQRQRIQRHLNHMTQRAGLFQIPVKSSDPIVMHMWMLQNRGQINMPLGERIVNRGLDMLARARYLWVLRDGRGVLERQLARYQAQALAAAQGGQQGQQG